MNENEPGSVDASTDEIVVRYRWTVEELIKAQRWHVRVVFWPIFRWLMWFLLAVLIAMSVVLLFYRDPIGILFLALAFYGVALHPKVRRWRLRRLFAGRPDRDSEVEWRISPDVIVVKTDIVKSEGTWASKVRVVQTPDGFLMYPNRQVLQWLPRCGFVSKADFERLARLAREKVADYRVLS